MAEVGSLALLIHAYSLSWFLNLQSRQVSGFGGVAKRLILLHLRSVVFRSAGTPTDSKKCLSKIVTLSALTKQSGKISLMPISLIQLSMVMI